MNKKIMENMMEEYTQCPFYDLDDIIDKEPKLINILAIFYSLNGMLSIIEKEFFNFQYSAEKLRTEMREYYNYICDIFAKMIYEYTYLACFGELRYMGRKIDQTNLRIISERFKDNSRGDRKAYVKYCFDAYGYTKSSIAQVSEFLFGQLEWEESFGGLAWRDIIKVVKLYGVMPNEIFIDHCVDIEHNTGSYLNKGCGIFSRKFNNVQSLLDDKRQRTPYFFMSEYFKYLDTKTIKFIIRFVNLMERTQELFSQYQVKGRKDDFLKSIDFNIYDFNRLNLQSERAKFSKMNSEVKENNFEIFKLSLFRPHSFGEENMADFIKVNIYDYEDGRYESVPLKNFMANPSKYYSFRQAY